MSMIQDIKRDRDEGGDDMPTNIMKVPVRVVSINLRRRSVERVLALENAVIAAEAVLYASAKACGDAKRRDLQGNGALNDVVTPYLMDELRDVISTLRIALGAK